MSILVYKQWHTPYEKHKGQTFSDSSHADHIGYIATRPGVYRNADEQHGLFGDLDGTGIKDIRRVHQAKQAVTDAAYQRRNVFRSVVSMSRETADELDLTSKDSWEAFIKEQVHHISEANGIKLENFRYVAAAHDEGHHPHVHIVFWDDAQKMRKSFVSPKIPDKARREMIKSVFADQIRDYCEQKDIACNSVRRLSGEIIEAFESEIISINPRKFARLLEMDTVDADFSDDEVKEFAKSLARLRNLLPPKGRISYKSISAAARDEADKIAWKLIRENPLLKAAVSDYVGMKMKTFGLYNTDLETVIENISRCENDLANCSDEAELMKLEKRRQSLLDSKTRLETEFTRYTDEAEKLVANKILKTVKDINAQFRHNEWTHKQWERFASDLLMSLLRGLDKQIRVAGLQHDTALSGELSAQARREKAIEARDRGTAR